MGKFSCLTHVSKLPYSPGHKVDTWHLLNPVKAGPHLPFWAIRPKRKQTAYQPNARVRRWAESDTNLRMGQLSSWTSPTRAKSLASNSRVMFASPGSGGLKECSRSPHFKDEHVWVLHKMPVPLLKPKRLYTGWLSMARFIFFMAE